MLKSLRWRIQLWHAAILAVVVLLFAIVVYVQRLQATYQQIDSELSAAISILASKIENSVGDVSVEKIQVPDTFAPRRFHHRFEMPYFVIWGSDGSQLSKSTDLLDVPIPPEIDKKFADGRTKRFRDRGSYREVYAVAGTRCVLVGRFIEKDLGHLNKLIFMLLATSLGVFAIGLFGGWILSQRSVQPIEAISRVATSMSEKNLSNRIDATTMDIEFAKLAETLNDAFARLDSAFAQQAQFTADASHELRTPLSVIQMHQELALSKPRSEDEYREAIETCQRSTKRMNSLVESLLSLARVDAGTELSLEEFDLTSVIVAAIEQTDALAKSSDIQVVNDSSPTIVNADRQQISQVIMNLIANAIRYSPPLRNVTISCGQDESASNVSVVDQGHGIASEDLSQIFDRFYRVDQHRTADSGGCGLGLSICKSIIDAHGGKLEVESVVGEGSRFRFSLPRSN